MLLTFIHIVACVSSLFFSNWIFKLSLQVLRVLSLAYKVSLLNKRAAFDLTKPSKEGRTFGGGQIENQMDSPGRLKLENSQIL